MKFKPIIPWQKKIFCKIDIDVPFALNGLGPNELLDDVGI